MYLHDVMMLKTIDVTSTDTALVQDLGRSQSQITPNSLTAARETQPQVTSEVKIKGCSQTWTFLLMYLSPHIVPSLTDSLSITTSPVLDVASFSSCCWQASSQGESLSTTPRQALV